MYLILSNYWHKLTKWGIGNDAQNSLSAAIWSWPQHTTELNYNAGAAEASADPTQHSGAQILSS